MSPKISTATANLTTVSENSQEFSVFWGGIWKNFRTEKVQEPVPEKFGTSISTVKKLSQKHNWKKI